MFTKVNILRNRIEMETHFTRRLVTSCCCIGKLPCQSKKRRKHLVLYHTRGRQSVPCWTPPLRSTARGSRRWSAGCGGGRPLSPGPQLPPAGRRVGSTGPGSPVTDPERGTPGKHQREVWLRVLTHGSIFTWIFSWIHFCIGTDTDADTACLFFFLYKNR